MADLSRVGSRIARAGPEDALLFGTRLAASQGMEICADHFGSFPLKDLRNGRFAHQSRKIPRYPP